MPSAANRRVKLNAKEFDEKTGMYYDGARYYEPRLGLWMSVDQSLIVIQEIMKIILTENIMEEIFLVIELNP